jgi:hypothetical protein
MVFFAMVIFYLDQWMTVRHAVNWERLTDYLYDLLRWLGSRVDYTSSPRQRARDGVGIPSFARLSISPQNSSQENKE